MTTSGEESEEKLQLEIKKEIEKLKYYVDNADEIIEEGDYMVAQNCQFSFSFFSNRLNIISI